ncbi:hypothetical protein KR51_00000490 [Rubidibacter lacunae KORDI 51-2]|uniref:Biopolymer transport protein n=1 Tax=Rubidibacter lacunae KORDI 51-2 TaxID=582515 RepID=U5DQQ6_9CHRO|nr:hypothetical protein [Rubidibacter lacunae]ERN43157.1 hypothetical protein KR51_00000490 [Rubidibacter lacunae KORDI 51-2]
MRRPSTPLARPQLELFPFLSVLACTIGSLILLIVVIAAQMLDSDREVAIVARLEAGRTQQKVPRYIEIRGDGVVIHPGEVFVSVLNLDDAKSPLVQLLDEIEQRRDSEYLIAAVRPSGVSLFDAVRTLIERREIDLGFEPIDETWQLRVEAGAEALPNSP